MMKAWSISAIGLGILEGADGCISLRQDSAVVKHGPLFHLSYNPSELDSTMWNQAFFRTATEMKQCARIKINSWTDTFVNCFL